MNQTLRWWTLHFAAAAASLSLLLSSRQRWMTVKPRRSWKKRAVRWLTQKRLGSSKRRPAAMRRLRPMGRVKRA